MLAALPRSAVRDDGETTVRLFSYILRHNDGFAPNPFHGWCTLACCKPVVRRVAKRGDWVVGLTSGSAGVVYVMQVDEKLTFAEYWADPRFACKKPSWTCDDPEHRCGDNIYRPLGGGASSSARRSTPTRMARPTRRRWRTTSAASSSWSASPSSTSAPTRLLCPGSWRSSRSGAATGPRSQTTRSRCSSLG